MDAPVTKAKRAFPKASAASAASAASDRRAVAVALHAQPAPEVPGRSSKRSTFGVAPKRLRPDSFESHVMR